MTSKQKVPVRKGTGTTRGQYMRGAAWRYAVAGQPPSLAWEDHPLYNLIANERATPDEYDRSLSGNTS